MWLFGTDKTGKSERTDYLDGTNTTVRSKMINLHHWFTFISLTDGVCPLFYLYWLTGKGWPMVACPFRTLVVLYRLLPIFTWYEISNVWAYCFHMVRAPVHMRFHTKYLTHILKYMVANPYIEIYGCYTTLEFTGALANRCSKLTLYSLLLWCLYASPTGRLDCRCPEFILPLTICCCNAALQV